MATFKYVALGGQQSGTIEAADRASALRTLAGRGEMPTSIEEIHDAAQAKSGGFRLTTSIPRTALGSLMKELSTAVAAGLPLVPALRTIRDARSNPTQREFIEGIIESVESGESLGDAAQKAGKPFDDLIVSLVQSGERAGRLGEVLDQCATLLDRETRLKNALIGALVYPAIILLLITAAIIIVVAVIVPRVLAATEGQIEVLPLPTRIVQGVAFFFADWWWAVLIALGLLVWAAKRVYAMPGPRLSIDRFTLGVPVLGPLVRDVAVSRFTRTLGTLVSAGLPVLKALSITKRTLGNKALEGAVASVGDKVSEGRTIAEPLAKSGYFPSLLVQLVAMGEQTGRLDELLISAAEAFEEKTEQGIALFVKVLPPIIIVFLAGIVGFILLAILLPLLAMQDAIGG